MVSLKNTILVLIVFIFLYAIVIWLRTPSQNRNWAEDTSRLAKVQWSDNNKTFTMQNIRDWSYSDTEVLNKNYLDKNYDLNKLESLWLYVQPIALGEAVAHTFLIFKFSGNSPQDYLGISIEARLEVGESYSAVSGLFRQLELHYTWATEQDLVMRRVVNLGYLLKRYKIKAETRDIQALLIKLIDTTNSLASTPRWYNTLLSNCTNELLKSANKVHKGTMPLHYSFFLTGYVDNYLDDLGYIDKSLPMLRIDNAWLETNMLREIKQKVSFVNKTQ